MGKREKILVILMVAVLAYGAFELLYTSMDEVEETDPHQEVREAQQISESMRQALEEAGVTGAQQQVLESAALDWPRELFHEFPEDELVTEEVREEEEDIGPFRYSGYIEMGDRKMAIINSREYGTGEELKDEQARVLEITSQEVLLESLGTGQRISVPYEQN